MTGQQLVEHVMRRSKESPDPLTPTSLTLPSPGAGGPGRRESRVYGLDSFKKTYAQNPKRSGFRAVAQAMLPSAPSLPSAPPMSPYRAKKKPEFNRLTKQLRLEEESEGSEPDDNDKANNAEREELMRISKNTWTDYPTDAILQRHQNNGKCSLEREQYIK